MDEWGIKNDKAKEQVLWFYIFFVGSEDLDDKKRIEIKSQVKSAGRLFGFG